MDVDFLSEDLVASLLIDQLAGGRAYARERRSAHKRLVAEIFSPPRLTGYLSRFPDKVLAPGFALDLTVMDPEDGMPWDFSRPEKREKARRLRKEQKPFLLIGSPMCMAFSTWQYLNEAKSSDSGKIKRERIRAALQLDFVASLYREHV